MSRKLEKKRASLKYREEELKRLNDENLNLELEIEQIRREIKILETRIQYLSSD